jgi:hypothetical protein
MSRCANLLLYLFSVEMRVFRRKSRAINEELQVGDVTKSIRAQS